jgi:hypothetical protein
LGTEGLAHHKAPKLGGFKYSYIFKVNVTSEIRAIYFPGSRQLFKNSRCSGADFSAIRSAAVQSDATVVLSARTVFFFVFLAEV